MLRSIAKGLMSFGAFFVVAALAAGGLLMEKVSEHYAQRSWSQTECTVLGTGIQELDDGEDVHYYVTVNYYFDLDPTHRFEFNGPIGGSYGTREAAEAAGATYPIGGRIPCWHDPVDPGDSTLSRAGPWSMLAILATSLGLGLLMLLAGVPLFLRTRKRRPTDAPPPTDHYL